MVKIRRKRLFEDDATAQQPVQQQPQQTQQQQPVQQQPVQQPTQTQPVNNVQQQPTQQANQPLQQQQQQQTPQQGNQQSTVDISAMTSGITSLQVAGWQALMQTYSNDNVAKLIPSIAEAAKDAQSPINKESVAFGNACKTFSTAQIDATKPETITQAAKNYEEVLKSMQAVNAKLSELNTALAQTQNNTQQQPAAQANESYIYHDLGSKVAALMKRNQYEKVLQQINM